MLSGSSVGFKSCAFVGKKKKLNIYQWFFEGVERIA